MQRFATGHLTSQLPVTSATSGSHNSLVYTILLFTLFVLQYKHYAIEQNSIITFPSLSTSSHTLSLVCMCNKCENGGEAIRLEGVILRRDLVVVEAAEEGNLLQDIGLDTRNAVEEEEGEDAG